MATLVKAAEIKRREAEKKLVEVQRTVNPVNRFSDPKLQFESLFRKQPAADK
ncbi:MAG: hypothetical protein ACREAC_08455 [Blastocatellia bacterium]